MGMRPEKVVRDCVRLKIAVFLNNARSGDNDFLINLRAVPPSQMAIIHDEMKKLEDMLREKAITEDEA